MFLSGECRPERITRKWTIPRRLETEGTEAEPSPVLQPQGRYDAYDAATPQCNDDSKTVQLRVRITVIIPYHILNRNTSFVCLHSRLRMPSSYPRVSFLAPNVLP